MSNDMQKRVVTLSAFLGVVSLLSVVFLTVSHVLQAQQNNPSTGTPTPTTVTVAIPLVPDKQAVLAQLQSVKLGTVSHYGSKDDTYNPDSWNILGSRTRGLHVEVTVTAGFDLSDLGSGDIEIEGDNVENAVITITMPPIHIDPSGKTSSTTNDTGVYTVFNDGIDSNTVVQKLNDMEQSLISDACTNLIQEAEDHAETEVKAILRSMTFPYVSVNFRPATCG